jgi:hypothetical protein
MKIRTFALAASGLLALAACDRGNQDQLNASDVNATQNLDELSDDAANVASEAQALENHAEQLNQEAQDTQDAAGAQTPADENIQGM